MSVDPPVSFIERIYEAATDGAALATLSAKIADRFDCGSSLIFLVDRATIGKVHVPKLVGAPSATRDFDDWARAAYADHFHDCNEWFARGSRKPAPAVVTGAELVDERTLLRLEFYQDYFRKLDAFHCLGAQFNLSGEVMGAIGFHRGPRAAEFTAHDKRRLARLLPHLQRALQISMRLSAFGARDQAAAGTLDALPTGFAVLGERGRLLFANAAAESVLRQADGLNIMNGRLTAARPDEAEKLGRLVAQACVLGKAGLESDGGGGALAISRPSGARPLALVVAPLRGARTLGEGTGGRVLVMISDPERKVRLAREVMVNLYGLSARQAQLAALVADGHDLTQAAERLAMSRNTARSHLRAIFAKTGTHRQSELVRLLGCAPLDVTRGNDGDA